jgi:hypothetical protein
VTDPRDATDSAEATRARAISVMIERIVRESHVANERERDALRQELEDHFDDAISAARTRGMARGDNADETTAALERFGDMELVVHGFRHAYRRGRRTLYAAKVVASAIAAIGISALLQLLVNLELASGALAVTQWYSLAVRTSIAVVIVAVAAWELEIEPLCARLERDPVRILVVMLALFALLFVMHVRSDNPVTAAHAFFGTAALIAVWTSTLAVLSRSDQLFLRVLGGEV